MNTAVEILEAAGYVKDGMTFKTNRHRFRLPGTNRRATVGEETVNFYLVADGNENNGQDWTNIHVRDQRAIEEHIKRPPSPFRITQSDANHLIAAVVNGQVSLVALGIAQSMKEHFMLKETLYNVESTPGI